MTATRRMYLWAVSYVLFTSTAACSGDATAPDFADLSGNSPQPTPPAVVALSLSPAYRTASRGESISFKASLLDAKGNDVSGPSVVWQSLDPSILQVDESGVISPKQEGVGRVVAKSGEAVDTGVVAVLGSKDVLVSALPSGTLKASRAAGDTVSVPVTIDLSRVSTSGDLGSIQFDVTFDPKVLEYVSSKVDASGGVSAVNLVEPGRLRFAYATTDPQGRALVQLLTLGLRVKSGASAGAFSPIAVEYTGSPTSTDFASYEHPVTVTGTVVVGQP